MVKNVIDFRLNWGGIDFDDVIAHNSGYPKFKLLEPLEGAKEAMLKLHEDGWKIKIYTARAWSEHRNIERYLKKHDIYFDDVICGKALFDWIIDDRNIPFDGDWKKTLKNKKLKRSK